MKRSGKIKISDLYFERENMADVFDGLEFSLYDVEYQPLDGVYILSGTSPRFCEMQEGAAIPFYTVEVNHRPEMNDYKFIKV